MKDALDTSSAPGLSRREFCQFLAQSAVLSLAAPSLFSSCAQRILGSSLPLQALAPLLGDSLRLAPGFSAREFIRWGAPLGHLGESFGYNNDFIAFQSLGEGDAWMWVNHESVHPGFVSGDWQMERKKSHVETEMKNVGGSLLRVQKRDGQWVLAAGAKTHKRFDAFTKIPFSGGAKIKGSSVALGTLANCAGGTTPWGTFLTCEENFDHFYGDRKRGEKTITPGKPDLAWHRYYDVPPEHYGWVVEIIPETFSAKKLVALGRFSHEAATVVTARDGRPVVYMGDDADNQCLYKFVGSRVGSLDEGTLFAADFKKGEWVPLDRRHPALKGFSDDLEVLTYARQAAHLVGATALDRPEDVEVHPVTGAIFVALTNNKSQGRPYGSILRIDERGGDHLSLHFESRNFVMGGEESGLACPDNLCFDTRGNLWVTNDISGKSIGTREYAAFGNNALFVVPTEGPHAGRALRVAEAPRDAELTGPCFAPDGQSLFVSVQHPGELSMSAQALTSHWPDGAGGLPCPAVMEIRIPSFS
jgi:secreted PhoX family phosphatase